MIPRIGFPRSITTANKPTTNEQIVSSTASREIGLNALMSKTLANATSTMPARLTPMKYSAITT